MAQPHRPTVVVLVDDDPPDLPEADDVAELRYVTEAELAGALPDADALFVWDFLSTAVAGAWPAAGGPRWVHIASAGVDRLLFPGLDAVVTNSRGVFEQPIADYVLMLVLSIAKDLPTTLRDQARRHWRHRATTSPAGQTALVVGTGPIGRAIGRRLAQFGLRVTGSGRVARSDDPDLGEIVGPTGLLQATAAADFVVLAAPLTEATRFMFDRGPIGAMRQTAWLINVGRGELVVEADLIAALRDDRIGGAALDVFAREPLPESSPLWDMPDVIVSPHMSGDLVGWRDDLATVFLDNLRRFVAGQPLRNVVDPKLGYVPS
jgi:phosphoglycerate dehydrogenase-like enzyme